MAEPRLHLVGVHGGRAYGSGADVLATADVIVGADRQLAARAAARDGASGTALGAPGRGEPPGPVLRALGSDLDGALRSAAAEAAAGQVVCVLASGDPGFFGLARRAAAVLGRERFSVHPAPSAVALAFARLGVHWDDAVVVSAHGRPLDAAVAACARHAKVAVLTEPTQPPDALGRALLAAGGPPRTVAVCSRLGEVGEAVWEGDVAGLAGGTFDPVAVVVVQAPGPSPGARGLEWGRPDEEYAARGGLITKAEVRAIVLGKLALPAAGVVWDVGAGSGSVAAECARLAPGVEVIAIERHAADADRIRKNCAGLAVRIVIGDAPTAFTGLPDPDRVFVGGGGLDVLDGALARVRPGGVVVATFAALERAAAAGRRLGNLASVAVSRGVPIGPDGALRLEAENPVFVCWGRR